VKLPFDGFAGEPRNTDALVVAQDGFGSYVIAVEAKADEPFSATVAESPDHHVLAASSISASRQ
jgi:hypothetical protein